MFGLDVDTLRNIRKTIAQFPHIEKVLIYGSRAKGNYKTGSDIDITLIAQDLTLKNSVYPLSTALDELYLPYTFDISIFDQLENPDFVDHILRVGKTFYQKENMRVDGWKTIPFVKCIRHIAIPKKIPRKQFMDTGHFPIVSQERDFINGYWSSEADVIHIESPLVVFGDHTQTLKYIDFDFVVGADGVKLLQPEAFLNPKYFYYFLMGNPVSSLGYSRHFRLLKELDIVFPESLCEQKRIVAVLDEAFTAIATATTNTEKNLANVKELFDSELNRVFQHPQSAEDSAGDGSNQEVIVTWKTVELGELCELVRGPFGGSLKKSNFVNEGFAVYEQQHAIRNQFTNIRYFITENKFNEMKRFQVNAGDLLMSCSGTMGKIAIVPDKFKRGIINQALLKITPSKSIDKNYLKFLLISNYFKIYLNEGSAGAAIKNVASVKLLKRIPIPFTPLEEQKRIATFLDKLSAEKQTLVETYKTKIRVLAELKQSMLHQAFTGELTADKNTSERVLSDAGV